MGTVEQPRLLIIGIDGADYQVTRSLMDGGALPNLHRLRQEGAFSVLRSTIPPLTPAAWTTLMTGKNPGSHGVFEWMPLAGEPRNVPVAAQRRAATVWHMLSAAGLTVGTFNVPATYPPEPLSGFQVAGFDAPAFRSDMAAPARAFELLQQRLGEYELFPRSIQQPASDREAVRRHVDLPRDGTNVLLRAFPCDVYMVTFQVVDWVQHGHLGRPESGDLVPQTYELVDERIGDILSTWRGPETAVLVASDHGATVADRLVNLEKLFLDHGLDP